MNALATCSRSCSRSQQLLLTQPEMQTEMELEMEMEKKPSVHISIASYQIQSSAMAKSLVQVRLPSTSRTACVFIYKLLNECTHLLEQEEALQHSLEAAGSNAVCPSNKSHVKSVLILAKMSAGSQTDRQTGRRGAVATSTTTLSHIKGKAGSGERGG